MIYPVVAQSSGFGLTPQWLPTPGSMPLIWQIAILLIVTMLLALLGL